MIDPIQFYQDIAKILKNRIVHTKEFKSIESFPLTKGKQAIYIMDWQKSQLVYSRGILEMLGYTEAEFTLQLASNCIHPEDLAVVNRIHRGVINLAIETDVSLEKQYLNLTLRLLKKDGDYLKVMRQSSPYHTDEEGRLISNLSVLTDISFMNEKTNLVKWELFADGINVSKFKQNIYKEFANFFTARELDVIHLIRNDHTNKAIAIQLFISVHTVVAHRKNIHKKSNCQNRKQLLKFCDLNGII